jgi:hypothetical protein
MRRWRSPAAQVEAEEIAEVVPVLRAGSRDPVAEVFREIEAQANETIDKVMLGQPPTIRTAADLPLPTHLQPATGVSPERSVARAMTFRASPSSLLWTLIPYAQPDLVEEVQLHQTTNLERIVTCTDAALFFGEEVERASPRGLYDRIVLWPQGETLIAATEREAFLRAYELLAPGGKLVAAIDSEVIGDATMGLRAWAAKKGATFDQPTGGFSKLGLILVTLQMGQRA